MHDASGMRSDLKLQVSVRKLACVLDPALLLCHAQGPTLALRLTQVMEPWLTRSFWQALDASELLLAAAQRQDDAASAPLSGAALAEWLALREATEPGAWLLRWIGDCVAESRLHEEADMRMLDRWEQIAESLSLRQEALASPGAGWCRRFDAGNAAIDTLALSATLDGAVVLCEATPQARLEPHPVAAARTAGLIASRLEPMPADSLFSAERQLLRHSLAQAGLAAVLEDRLRLAAVHVQAAPEAEGADPWQGTRVTWYTV
jgi:hypothetical protein